MPPVMFVTDLAAVGGDYCRCRCVDNHPINHGSRVGLVCRVLLAPNELDRGVCQPCVDAMVDSYGG